MTKIMTAPEMTDGQIENAVNKLRDAMRKHRSKITSDVAQQVLGIENLGMMMFVPFRERAEAVSNLITRTITVNRTRTPQEVLDATGRTQYKNKNILANIPKGVGESVEVVFFNLGRDVSEDDLEKEYEIRTLKPADPYSLATVNEADPSFADKHPNCTLWKDADSKWCLATFRNWHGERYVIVNRRDHDVNVHWWFAGLRK